MGSAFFAFVGKRNNLLMIWNDEDISIVYLLKPNKPITLHCDKAHIGI